MYILALDEYTLIYEQEIAKWKMECGTGIPLFHWTLSEKHIGKLSTVKHKLVLVIAAVEVLELSGENIKSNKIGKIEVKDNI